MAAGTALSIVFAGLQLHMISALVSDQYHTQVDVAYGVVIGKPHWRLWQSRVLGPYMVQWASHFFSSYFWAHTAVTFVCLVVGGLLAWRLGWIIGHEIKSAVIALLVLQLGILFSLSGTIPIIWDFIGIVLFLEFVTFVYESKPWPYLCGLFAVAIWNRESAEFIALWMIVDPLTRWALAKRSGQRLRYAGDWQMAVAGALCVVAGVVLVEVLRRVLLIEEVGPKLFPNYLQTLPYTYYFQLQLLNNLRAIVVAATSAQAALLCLPLVIFAVAICLGYRYSTRFAGLAITHLIYLGSVLAFGAVFETRVYLELWPFVVISAVLLTQPRSAPRPSPLPAVLS